MHIRHFAQLPKPYFAYPKVIQGLIFKKQKSKKLLPEAEYIVDSIQIDREHLNTYKTVCGFQDNGNIPAIYLAVLSQSLQMHMMTKEDFPFAILGLVHIRNQVTQFRQIAEDEVLTLSCKFGELKPHDKGVQFDFITTAKVGNDVVMEGLTTYLSRQKVTEQVSNKKIEDHRPNLNVQEQWNIPENIGRRYALVSGDFNLIHLHALTAKTFGFKQAIAHGMWTNAKALASLNLPEKYQSDVWFKLPMYLPSQVEFLTAEATDVTDILIRNTKNQKPHVVGTIKAI